MSLSRPATRFEADPVVRISCRHCQRSWGHHAPDGRCHSPLETLFSTWRARWPKWG
ncbi:MAG TPA: hypothetical protein VNX21_03165 [Candidatus Thermoplasmatota archaeon]|nr:hypothetical protein [Candidatus Thermoplasmatota archaeon]